VAIATPSSGAVIPRGTAVTVTATASDADGSISQVTLRVDGNTIAVANVAPYTTSWTPTVNGSYSLTAVATDNGGASTTSAAVSVTVTDPPPAAEQTTTTLSRGSAGYDGVADAYLSSYHPSSNFGARSEMYFNLSNYVPLIRFAVFNSEGGPVPDGAVIESARLRLYKGAYDNVIALHAMLRPWAERQATWTQTGSGQSWAVAGAGGAGSDYRSAPDAQISAPWAAGWIEFDITDRVRSYLTGTPNYGWRLRQVSGYYYFKRIRSSEYTTSETTRPTLEVVWHIAAD
jgi:hypothetical protein